MKELMRLPVVLCLFSFPAVTACREAFTNDVTVVARAGDAELSVARLAEIFAQGKALAIKRDVIDRVARLWVDYSLLADRVVAGDSLLDSTTVVATLWPEVEQRLADHLHDGLVNRESQLDSARIDSVYAAGDYRLLQHILVRSDSSSASPTKAAKRLRAGAIRARLLSGGSWAEANRSNEDQRTKNAGGSLGVMTRGEMAPALEQAAFALAPGAVSAVVEGPEGFHILRRPALQEQRAAFAAGIQGRLVERMDSSYLAALSDRRHVRVESQAPAMVRAALADPLEAASSRAVLGTFDGGRFTVASLIRWVNAMPVQVEQQLGRANDGQIVQFVRSLMRNEALMAEAQSNGITLTPLDLQEFRDILRRDLGRVRTAVGLDDTTLARSGATPDEKRRVAALRVDQYLEQLASNKTPFVGVPSFLAAQLRARSSWSVSSAGVERVFERTSELRAVVDSLKPASPPVDPSLPTPSRRKNAP